MDSKKLCDKELEEVVGGIPDPSWQILNANPDVGGVCGENNGMITGDSYISSDSMPGGGVVSTETYYGGICGLKDVH